jgi:hypothetical protein
MFRRSTTLELLHSFTGGAQFTYGTLDENFTQILRIAQEAVEGGSLTDIFSDLDMHGYQIKNIGPAVADNDALSLGQYKADANGASAARVGAEAAAASALASKNAAAVSETNALAYRNTAQTAATNAGSSASAASGFASTASTSATNAGNSATAAASSASAAAASAAGAMPSQSVVRGYVRVPGATVGHQQAMQAQAVTLRNASGAVVTRYATGAITNDKSTVGVNGRDSATAPGSLTAVHLYFIWNGTTLATLSSLSDQSVGPTLPSGYTHWAYADTLVTTDSSNQYTPSYTAGGRLYYDFGLGGIGRVLSGGTSTTYADIGSVLVPAVALRVTLQVILSLTASTGGSATVYMRAKGMGSDSSWVATVFRPDAGVMSSSGIIELPRIASGSGLSQYRYNGPGIASGGVFVDIMGYTVPNGDS